jgi:predicted SnoaL-like aldol condensation-catalyzing enzyme
MPEAQRVRTTITPGSLPRTRRHVASRVTHGSGASAEARPAKAGIVATKSSSRGDFLETRSELDDLHPEPRIPIHELPDYLADHEKVALEFLRLVSEGRAHEALDSCTPDCRHHNPFFVGDMEVLALGLSAAALTQRSRPTGERLNQLDLKHVISTPDLVVVHSHLHGLEASGGILQAHIFRFEDGRIAEYWDIRQVLPLNSPNSNGPI